MPAALVPMLVRLTQREVQGLGQVNSRCILAPYRQRGASTLAHGNRDRKHANATLDNVIAEVIHKARIQLGDFLSELEGLQAKALSR